MVFTARVFPWVVLSRTRLPLTLIVLAGGCATSAASSGRAADVAPVVVPATVALRWPVKTVPHVDLWLHAFAMLSTDSATVPLYRRGYADSLTVVKNSRNVLTALDANRATLVKRLATAGYLQAQFLPFAFANWDDMRTSIERFQQFEGDPRRAPDREVAAQVALIAGMFPAPADREWLRLFSAGVEDERMRFFAAEQARLVRTRVDVISAVDSLWQQVYRPKFERFLNNTGQRQGDLVLSVPIGGEGRSAVGRDRQTMVTVPFPARVEDAVQVLYVLAHEVTGALVGNVIADNSTPAEQRAGAADRYVSMGQVRAGLLLLDKSAPELREGYQRFYLAQAGVTVSVTAADSALRSAFETRFPLPPVILGSLQRQIEIVLGGI